MSSPFDPFVGEVKCGEDGGASSGNERGGNVGVDGDVIDTIVTCSSKSMVRGGSPVQSSAPSVSGSTEVNSALMK